MAARAELSQTALTEQPMGPSQVLPVYPASALTVAAGANFGDAVGPPDMLEAGDIYRLSANAVPGRLSAAVDAKDQLTVAPGSELGIPGAPLALATALTLMTPLGATVDLIVLVQGETVFALPLAPLTAGTDYTLVGVDPNAAAARFAEIACVSFTRGTHLTLASGVQCAIETLRAGDMVLTRDHGPQPVRWVGHQTVRASGGLAPIRIAEGALNNARDLIVSPHHRLFVYRRRDRVGTGRAETLVQARHLVNGVTVTREPSAFIDYVQVLFDRHEIIYAEGIAAESLILDPRTRPALPDRIRGALRDARPAGWLAGAELHDGTLDAATAAEALRRASAGSA